MFADRRDAGVRLAERLAELDCQAPIIYALPRGGVPVAAEVAERLGAPLDLIMVRKLGVPGQPELAAGAVVDGVAQSVVYNPEIMRHFGLSPEDLSGRVAAELDEIARRRVRYLGPRGTIAATGRCAIVVDDGIATGATVRAALRGLRTRTPAKVILAVPVAPRDTLAELNPLVDRLVCLETPEPFWAVGAAYGRFDQVSDDEVAAIMTRFGAPEH